MILFAISSEEVRYTLLLAAILIIGAVVVPRLGGWIFNPKDQSFLYVLAVIIGLIAFWFREPLMTFKEEHAGLFALVVAIFIAFLAMIFIVKDKSKKKE